MTRRTVNRSEYEENPYAAWNAFVDILAMESADDLSEIQQHAHFAFTYYSEVENGGHLQYFRESEYPAWGCHGTGGQGSRRARSHCGAIEHRAVLSQAIDRWMATSRRRIGSVGEYVETASQGEFDDLDKACWQCQPKITVWLERYLDSHFADFIELE